MNYYERTLILALLVIACLLGLHFLPSMAVGGVELRRVNLLSDLFPAPSFVEEDDFEPPAGADSTAAPAVARPAPAAECPPGVTCIEDYAALPDEGMERFYRRLLEARSGTTPVRIAYFGDSFIEGDIFTADLRDLLQGRFGGSGVGFVDIASLTAGFRQSVRATSTHFTLHSVTDRGFDRALMGINERYARATEAEASATLSGTRYGKHTGRASRSTLYFVTPGPLQVTARVNGGEARSFAFEGSSRMQRATVAGDVRRVAWSVRQDSAALQACFYGMTMDADTGVVLDNFSLRGSSGQTLSAIPRARLEDFARERPYDLVVLHFGLNVANAKSAALRYEGYVAQMQKVIRLFREMFPQAALLVVSVSDRDSRDENGELTTIKGLRALVSAQQRMAAENGTAFWNLFQAMGGEASMKALAHADPPMANKDYTHLNFRGGRFLAQKLFEALTSGVANYEKKQEHEKN